MTTGTKCCIHYKDGLPYCVECEKESDQRREELHAKLAGAEIAMEQARADAGHWKSECNALQRMVHEARAEIEQMREALLLFAEGAIHDFHYVCQHRDNCLCLACQKARVKAALAVERGE